MIPFAAYRTIALFVVVISGLAGGAWWLRGQTADTPYPTPAAGAVAAFGAAGAPSPSTASPSPSPSSASPSPAATSASVTRPPVGAGGGRCAAVTVVAARGTGERAGTGFLLGQVARQVDAAVSAPVRVVGLNYPASSDFGNSSRQGIAELRRLIGAERGGACLVLLGYSQGAIVVGDALAALGAGDAAKVRAVVMFGDPRFNSAEPYNEGSFAANSRGLNRRPTGQLATFASRIQNYCNGGDSVCQGSGARGEDGHLDYNRFAGRAAAFVATKV